MKWSFFAGYDLLATAAFMYFSAISQKMLAAAKPTASTYQPLARHLFNAAFVAVWNELTNGKKKEGKWACGKQCSSVIVFFYSKQRIIRQANFFWIGS